MRSVTVDAVLPALEEVLSRFDRTAMMYLDGLGNWIEGPKTIRDRISNELWFAIWKEKQGDRFVQQLTNLLHPFIRSDVAWDITVGISRSLLRRESVNNTLHVILEVLYKFIEYNAFDMNSKAYVADFDHEGRNTREESHIKARECMNEIRGILASDEYMSGFLEIVELLKNTRSSDNQEMTGDTIFNEVSMIIAEEEKVRRSVEAILTAFEDPEKKQGFDTYIDEDTGKTLDTLTEIPQALVRSCLELLANKAIPVSSGIQFRAASILGGLKDPRCFKSLLGLLDCFDTKHTNIRTNMIYAIGNIMQIQSLEQLGNILREEDTVDVYLEDGALGYKQSLDREKCEAIWALGKLGADAIKAVPLLRKFVNYQDVHIQLALAWAGGMIGRAQKHGFGGVDADLVAMLMNLLTKDDSRVIEEAIYSLKKLELPDFVHSLYLHSMKTIPTLSLKPSSTGLYELSETIFHLMSVRKNVVMAVTGDSGTGKTYFCEAIKNGFGGIREGDILYLMRDDPGNMSVFHRMLGIEMLKKHLDPELYQSYPYSEDNDDPEAFFEDFIDKCSGKKLIILDGWMDDAFFYHIIRKFYKKDFLDIIVNFRTTFSTKRLNLEEREGLLERVNTCLSYVENPLIEQTEFYHDSDIFIYNLDNSMASRLNNEEIFEIFHKRKIDVWGDYIRVGEFTGKPSAMKIQKGEFEGDRENFSCITEDIRASEAFSFTPDEANFMRLLNDDIEANPNLLQVVKFHDFNIERIIHFGQGQLACCSHDGKIGILSGLNDHILYTRMHESEPAGLALVGNDICSMEANGDLKIVSFDKNTMTDIERSDSPPCSIASDHEHTIVTGHLDGSIRVWNLEAAKVRMIRGHVDAVQSIFVDRSGKIYTGSRDGRLCAWDMLSCRVKTFVASGSVYKLGRYTDGRVIIGVNSCDDDELICHAEILILDLEANAFNIIHTQDNARIDALYVYFDGRVMAGVSSGNGHSRKAEIMVLDPRSDPCRYRFLGKHGYQIRDCLAMGPRIITCGSEDDSASTLRIWGTEAYVKTDLKKLRSMPETVSKPSYYSTFF